MIKLQILIDSLDLPLVVKWTRFESNKSKVKRSKPAHQLFFIFEPENILRSNLDFSTSYGRLID